MAAGSLPARRAARFFLPEQTPAGGPRPSRPAAEFTEYDYADPP